MASLLVCYLQAECFSPLIILFVLRYKQLLMCPQIVTWRWKIIFVKFVPIEHQLINHISGPSCIVLGLVENTNKTSSNLEESVDTGHRHVFIRRRWNQPQSPPFTTSPRSPENSYRGMSDMEVHLPPPMAEASSGTSLDTLWGFKMFISWRSQFLTDRRGWAGSREAWMDVMRWGGVEKWKWLGWSV